MLRLPIDTLLSMLYTWGMTILIRNVPEALHKQFKAYTALSGESINGALIRLMADEVKRKGGKVK